MKVYNEHYCLSRRVCENLSEEEALRLEAELIMYYRTVYPDLMTNIADGYLNEKQWKASLSEQSKKMWADSEFRQRMIDLRHDPNGPYQSKEFREKISRNVAGVNNPNYGHFWTDEQKEHLSQVRKQNGKSAGINNNTATKIICLETGEIFDLIKDAINKYHVKYEASFTVALNEPQRTAAGLHWRRYSSELEDEQNRFLALLNAYYKSKKPYLICLQTQEFFRKSDVQKMISHRKLEKAMKQDKKVTIDDKDYMYVTDYVDGRLYE